MNQGIKYVVTQLKIRLSDFDGSRLLIKGSHHLNSWLCNYYVLEFARQNKQLTYDESFQKCYPIIEMICNSKPEKCTKNELLSLVEFSILCSFRTQL